MYSLCKAYLYSLCIAYTVNPICSVGNTTSVINVVSPVVSVHSNDSSVVTIPWPLQDMGIDKDKLGSRLT